MIVVSEIGEQWSPKTPPLKIDPTIRDKLTSSRDANGMPIGSMMAKVPQEVPVENEIADATINSNAGTTTGFAHFDAHCARNGPVPSSVHSLPIANARTMSSAIVTIDAAPFRIVSVISVSERIL